MKISRPQRLEKRAMGRLGGRRSVGGLTIESEDRRGWQFPAASPIYEVAARKRAKSAQEISAARANQPIGSAHPDHAACGSQRLNTKRDSSWLTNFPSDRLSCCW